MPVWLLLSLIMNLFLKCDALQVSGLSYINSLKPGETANFTVTLTSDKDTSEIVEFKLCDYWCNSEGQHYFEDIGLQIRTNAKWISLGAPREIINPGEQKNINVTINVPKNNGLLGSYWSVLLIEPNDPLHTLQENDLGFQFHVKIRYAYHIVTNIGNGSPSLKIIKKEFSTQENKKYLVVDVENTGNLFLNPKLTLKLFNKQGKNLITAETQKERLYPGSSSRYVVKAEDLPSGDYTAFILLDNGDGRLFNDTFAVSIL